MRTIFKVIGTVTVSLFVAVILFEGFLQLMSKYSLKLRQLTYSPYRKVNFESLADLSMLVKSSISPLAPGDLFNGFRASGKGFLTPDLPYEKPPTEYRIVYIGDSFGIGVVPYPLHFIRQAESRLKLSVLERDVKVINLSMISIGPGYYQKLLELEGLKYKPDLIIINFFVGNDFSDGQAETVRFQEFIDKATMNNSVYMPLYNSRSISLLRNSYNLLKNRNSLSYADKVNGYVLGKFTGEGTEEYDPNSPNPNLSESAYFDILSRKLDVFRINSEVYKSLPEVYQQILAIKQNAESIGARLLFVIIPDEVQVNSELMQKVLTQNNLSQNEMQMSLPQELLIEFFRQQTIDYIDLLPQFLEYPQPKLLYQPRDTHINSLGNQKVAEILYEKLYPIIKADTSSQNN